MKTFLFRCTLCALFISSANAHAESELSVAKSAQNPLAVNIEARHFTLPFNNYTNFSYGPNQNTQNILDLKPVTPFPFTQNYDVIFRTIIPITHQPTPGEYINGLGDINPTIFLAPAKNNWFIWGLGPTVVLPTATNPAIGAGKWSIGPELVLIAMPGQWTFAILTNNIWSVAGQSNRPQVNELTFQYSIAYNFRHGWYINSQPTLTANWMASPSQQWTVPFGLGVGRAFSVGDHSVNLSIQGYSNVIRPSTGARWTLQCNLEFLFPDHRTTMA